MFILLIGLGCLLSIVGFADIVRPTAKRALPSKGAALVILLLGMGSCVGGATIGAGKLSDEPTIPARTDDCILPEGIASGSAAAKVNCEMQAMAASDEDRYQLALAKSPEQVAITWKGLPVPVLGNCREQGERDMLCVTSQISFIEKWPLAWARDPVAMGEAAYCFGTGCSGAVVKNPVDECAWRIAMAEDDRRARSCDALGADDRAKAENLARQILRS